MTCRDEEVFDIEMMQRFFEMDVAMTSRRGEMASR